MSRTQVIGATLLLALLAPAGRDLRATGSTADIVFEWNQILQDTVPVPHNPLTPRFFSMTHIAMFDAINTLEREFEPYRVRLRHPAGGSPKPRPRKPRTMCSSSSTRRPPRPTMRRSRVRLETGRRASSAGVRLSVPASPRKFWRGDRTTGGSSRLFHRIPSRCCPDAGSRPRRTTRRRHSPIFRKRHRWRC